MLFNEKISCAINLKLSLFVANLTCLPHNYCSVQQPGHPSRHKPHTRCLTSMERDALNCIAVKASSTARLV